MRVCACLPKNFDGDHRRARFNSQPRRRRRRRAERDDSRTRARERTRAHASLTLAPRGRDRRRRSLLQDFVRSLPQSLGRARAFCRRRRLQRALNRCATQRRTSSTRAFASTSRLFL